MMLEIVARRGMRHLAPYSLTKPLLLGGIWRVSTMTRKAPKNPAIFNALEVFDPEREIGVIERDSYFMLACLSEAIDFNGSCTAAIEQCPSDSPVGRAIQTVMDGHAALYLALENCGDDASDLDERCVRAINVLYYG